MIIDIAFDNPDSPHAGVEVLTFDELRTRLKSEVARRPSRLDFHQIILVRGGEGTAMVDFVDYECTRGTLLHLRPGQVQRLPYGAAGQPADLDAVLLLFTPGFPPPLPAAGPVLDGFGPVAWSLPPDTFGAFDRAVQELVAVYRSWHGTPAARVAGPGPGLDLTGALLRQLLGALLLRMAALSDPDGDHDVHATTADVYLAFRRELERSFATTRSVETYAVRLGYAPRTLTRACQAATGRTAKQLIDARVSLEAQRLLAHTDQPVSAIAHALGFTEATNFGKFFARQTGLAPGDFRHAQR
ncbi:helix-turn-helix domain-containing protein [Catenulispora sp. GAS73]|uniref:helix-turn-helix domain-containing protein n=1 Tax=Catenulispora sp. GAS73 TaxID=3156269 RepID=UPI0035131102